MTPKVTLESIDAKIDEQIGRLDKKIGVKIENLATTMDSLAAIVKDGFVEVHDKLKQLDKLSNDVAQINRRLYTAVYEPELNALERRVVRIERHIRIPR